MTLPILVTGGTGTLGQHLAGLPDRQAILTPCNMTIAQPDKG
jgi:hypothetical protein